MMGGYDGGSPTGPSALQGMLGGPGMGGMEEELDPNLLLQLIAASMPQGPGPSPASMAAPPPMDPMAGGEIPPQLLALMMQQSGPPGMGMGGPPMMPPGMGPGGPPMRGGPPMGM